MLELLVSLGITSVVMMTLVLGIYQIAWGTIRSNDRTVVLNDISHALYWIKQDLQTAQYTDLINGNPVPASSLSMSWIDMTSLSTDNVTYHDSYYVLSGTELLRTHDGNTTIVGRHVTSIGFTLDYKMVTCNITFTDSRLTQSETLAFSVKMRSEQIWD